MKYGDRLLLILMVLMATMVLASCLPSVVKNGRSTVEVYKIKLQADRPSNELAIRTPGSSRCKGLKPKAGCVAVGKTNMASIRFRLEKSKGWYLNEFKVCLNGTKASQVCNLTEAQRDEFMVTDKNGTIQLFPTQAGVVDLTQLPGQPTEFYLFDYNSTKQDFFYTIKACNENPDIACLDTDPPIENGGRGRN